MLTSRVSLIIISKSDQFNSKKNELLHLQYLWVWKQWNLFLLPWNGHLLRLLPTKILQHNSHFKPLSWLSVELWWREKRCLCLILEALLIAKALSDWEQRGDPECDGFLGWLKLLIIWNGIIKFNFKLKRLAWFLQGSLSIPNSKKTIYRSL